jgi:hypothetical protein
VARFEIGADPHCVCCAQTRVAIHMESQLDSGSGPNAAAAACLYTLLLVERDGAAMTIGSLCPECRAAFALVKANEAPALARGGKA